jgi:hypothetical protein
MEYGAVNSQGLRAEDDEGLNDSSPVSDDFADELKSVRAATGGASLKVSLEFDGEAVEGCAWLQLFGALLFQTAAGNISKVSFEWYEDGEEEDTAEWVEGLLGKAFDSSCMPQPDFDQSRYTIHMFGETVDTCYDGCAASGLHKLAWAGDCVKLRRFGPDLDVSTTLSGDGSGLHDEDSLGEYTALHVAAYKGNLDAFLVLADELKADVNRSAFDGSTSLHLAVSQGHGDIVDACLARGVKVNAQRYADPGWQSFMIPTAGFTALHMAINCRHSTLVDALLKGGADTTLYTGPLSGRFPKHVRLDSVYEYGQDGHRYTPLHVAVQMNDVRATVSLLNAPDANTDARVRSGMHGDDMDYFMSQGTRFTNKQLVLSMSTPLHLASHNSASDDAGDLALALLSKDANLLAQNYQLELAGAKLSAEQLGSWVWHQAQGRETLLLLGRMGVPRVVGMLVLEHVVGLHLSVQYAKALQTETSVVNAPLFALRVIGDAEYDAQKEEVFKRYATKYLTDSWEHRQAKEADAAESAEVLEKKQAQDAAFSRLVACELEKSKRPKTMEFLERLVGVWQRADTAQEGAGDDNSVEAGAAGI